MMGKKVILTIILIVSIAAVTVFYFLNKSKTENSSTNKMTYVNLLQEIQFQAPEDWILEDILNPRNIVLYPNKEAVEAAAKSEEEFYNSGNIHIKMLREIPGKDIVFDIFIEKEFEKALSDEKLEWSKEKFVTEIGYNAYRFQISKPFEYIYIVIDSPVAYWVSAKSETEEVKAVVNTLGPDEDQNEADAKRPSVKLESFLQKMEDVDIDGLYGLSTEEFSQKYSKSDFEQAIQGVEEQLGRLFIVVSCRFDSERAYVRAVLENQDENDLKYAAVTAELKKVGEEYKMNAIQIDKDREGLASQQTKPLTGDKAKDLFKQMR